MTALQVLSGFDLDWERLHVRGHDERCTLANGDEYAITLSEGMGSGRFTLSVFCGGQALFLGRGMTISAAKTLARQHALARYLGVVTTVMRFWLFDQRYVQLWRFAAISGEGWTAVSDP